MKRFLSIALILLLLLTLALPVMADEDYEIVSLDPFTGQPMEEATEAQAQSSDYIYINENCHYDRLQRAFAYELGTVSSARVYSSVAYGMVTTEPVSISLPNGVIGTLYHDGVAVENPDFGYIADPGSYVLSVSGSSSQTVQPLSFTIVNITTGALDSYQVPQGFSITSIVRDSEQQPFVADEASLITEGDYIVTYQCNATGLTYSLSVNVDHTPPQLELANVRDGVAGGPVDISDVEEGCAISITCDGKPISYNKRLTQNGIYRIVLTDIAGNTNIYNFRITFYFNVTSILFIITVIGLIAALLGYLLFTRKHLRVR